MKRLAIAPHRLYFFLGGLAVTMLFCWWLLQLLQQQSQALPLHALLMPLGVFPLFILGFTFTAGPRWLALDTPDHDFMLHGATYFVGMLLVLCSAALGLHALRSSGFVFMLAAWCAVTWRWIGLLRHSRTVDKQHARALAAAMLGGALALLATLCWSAGWSEAWLAARELSFFAFLLPVFLTVCHRMLPFFSSNVLAEYTPWRPERLLTFWLSGCVLQACADMLAWHWLAALNAAALAVSFLYTSWRWGIARSLQNRLLAMLHLSFAWLSVVFALQTAASLGLVATSAALHALALGFMGTMLVAFVSRVSFGHSGRPLQVSNFLWLLYLALHAAAIARVAASLLAMPALLIWSAAAWLLLLIGWMGMMLPLYLGARADGKPG